ncbi:MAG: Ada metal-binding domain-containing protein, partial [bacterium]|nr:Ada metal-binding domain-containing protein [bacterium]
QDPAPIIIENSASLSCATSSLSASQIVNQGTAGVFVASVNGKYYHLPQCPSAKNISEKNKIWFQTKAEAESRGFKPASNCPGLQNY